MRRCPMQERLSARFEEIQSLNKAKRSKEVDKTYPPVEKERWVQRFIQCNRKYPRLRLWERPPPRTTLLGWMDVHDQGGEQPNLGRPTILLRAEEEKLATTLQGIPQHGAPVDRETLAQLGGVLMKEMRNSGEVVPQLTGDWVQSFRRRRKLSRLRLPSSDRLPDTPQDIQADNAWRTSLLDVIAHPSLCGIPVRGAWAK